MRRILLTADAPYIVRDRVVAEPSLIGQRVAVTMPVSDAFDQLQKGLIKRETPEAQRRVNDRQIAWFDQLAAAGLPATPGLAVTSVVPGSPADQAGLGGRPVQRPPEHGPELGVRRLIERQGLIVVPHVPSSRKTLNAWRSARRA